MKKGFAAALVIVVIAIGILVGGVAYFYKDTHRPQSEQVSYSRNTNEVLKDLNKATYKLQEETAKLNALEKLTGGTKVTGNSTVDVRASIQKDIAEIKAKAVVKTDVFFQDPGTSHPKIIVPTASQAIQTSIDTKRAQINALIVAWENKVASISSINSTTNANLIAEAKVNVATIQTYLTELDKIVDALTPANSGLTQSQIDAYEAIVVTAEKQINDLSNVIATLPASPTAQNNQTTSSGTSSGQTQQQIQDQIAAQQEAVNQAVEQVNNLQNELQQAQQAEQQQQAANQTPAATTTTNTGQNQNQDQNSSSNNTDNSHVIHSDNSNPNPNGGVQLLQGW